MSLFADSFSTPSTGCLKMRQRILRLILMLFWSTFCTSVAAGAHVHNFPLSLDLAGRERFRAGRPHYWIDSDARGQIVCRCFSRKLGLCRQEIRGRGFIFWRMLHSKMLMLQLFFDNFGLGLSFCQNQLILTLFGVAASQGEATVSTTYIYLVSAPWSHRGRPLLPWIGRSILPVFWHRNPYFRQNLFYHGCSRVKKQLFENPSHGAIPGHP